jgi:hypothetical protein
MVSALAKHWQSLVRRAPLQSLDTGLPCADDVPCRKLFNAMCRASHAAVMRLFEQQDPLLYCEHAKVHSYLLLLFDSISPTLPRSALSSTVLVYGIRTKYYMCRGNHDLVICRLLLTALYCFSMYNFAL